MLLINSKFSGNLLLIDRKLLELEDDAQCTSLSKFTKLVKKPSNLTKTRKKNLIAQYLIPWLVLLSLLGGLAFVLQRAWWV